MELDTHFRQFEGAGRILHSRQHAPTSPRVHASAHSRHHLRPRWLAALAPLAGLADKRISAKAGGKGIAVFIRLWKRVDPKTHDKANPRQLKA